jgi:hypothetical protein
MRGRETVVLFAIFISRKFVVKTVPPMNAAEQILNGLNSAAGERQRFGRNRTINSVNLGSADRAIAMTARDL